MEKKNEILSFAVTWMNLDTIILSEVSQTNAIIYDMTYMWKIIQMNLYTKQKWTYKFMVTKGERKGRRDKLGAWD